MLDRTTTLFSHVKPTDTDYQSGGLRDFFLYQRHGRGRRHARQRARVQRVKANEGTGEGHRLAPP
jgi:hypothetical protein